MTMKGKPYNLYFFVCKDQFKLGVTKTIKNRLEVIGDEIDEVVDFKKSFYFELTESIAKNLESMLKRKYKDYTVDGDQYKTEMFYLDCIDLMIDDITEYHNLFDIKLSKKILVDKYVAIYDDNGRVKVQLTKNVKRLYDIFKGKEEYFEEIFKKEAEELEEVKKIEQNG